MSLGAAHPGSRVLPRCEAPAEAEGCRCEAPARGRTGSAERDHGAAMVTNAGSGRLWRAVCGPPVMPGAPCSPKAHRWRASPGRGPGAHGPVAQPLIGGAAVAGTMDHDMARHPAGTSNHRVTADHTVEVPVTAPVATPGSSPSGSRPPRVRGVAGRRVPSVLGAPCSRSSPGTKHRPATDRRRAEGREPSRPGGGRCLGLTGAPRRPARKIARGHAGDGPRPAGRSDRPAGLASMA